MMMATCTRCGTLDNSEFLTHDKSCGVTYTIADNVFNTMSETFTPRNPYASGYGSKIPTRYMVKYESGRKYEKSRWRRVYMMQYGNAGSAYILVRGKTLFLDSNTDSKLEGMFR